ncbi:MAG: hypothetical protein HFI43_02670 [Lachnospiraceae bacterium]|jgi:hypothetical protein|nr:hypothetical protein [Lachnospiraceae bacterium]
MDNDLISRNKAVQFLRAYADEVGCKRGEYELANGILKAACFLEDSENVPTDYDVYNVLARLEEKRKPIYRADGSLMAERTLIEIDNVIDLVKFGGVIG